MVRSAAENDGLKPMLSCKFQSFFSLFLNFHTLCVISVIGIFRSLFYFFEGQIRIVISQCFPNFFRECFLCREVQIWIEVTHRFELLNIRSKKLRIISNNWTVKVVVALLFIKIIAHTWIEDGINTLIQQVFNMSMHQFCRVARRIRWN